VNDDIIQLEFPVGEACGATNRTTIMELVCDKNSTKPVIDTTEFDPDRCSNKIIVKTRAACPVGKYEAWYERFNIYVTTSALVILGLIYMIFGFRFEIITIPILIAVTTSLILHSIAPNIPTIACICFGLAFVLLTQVLEKIVYFTIIFILSNFITGFGIHGIIGMFSDNVDSDFVYWGSVVVIAIILLMFLSYIEKLLKIIITSIVGAFLLTRVK
jgi:hypothetical protein